MRRGEVWWVELAPPVGSRPVVILTRDEIVNSIGAVVVALVTRTQRGLLSEVPVGRVEGLPRPSVINLDNILTVSKHRLLHLMGSLNKERMVELDRALQFALGLRQS